MVEKVITIDGPSGVGKGTVSRKVAMALGWDWLDSGSLYRLTAFVADREGCALDDIEGLVNIASHLNVRFDADPSAEDPLIYLDDEAVNTHIRNENVAEMASRISAYSPVRAALLARQQAFLTDKGLVADGRDMGTVVFPLAPAKFFLIADPKVRAERRHKQLLQMQIDVNMTDLLREFEVRDERDRNRVISPMRPAEDAVTIDTSALDAEQVFQEVMAVAKKVFG